MHAYRANAANSPPRPAPGTELAAQRTHTVQNAANSPPRPAPGTELAAERTHTVHNAANSGTASVVGL